MIMNEINFEGHNISGNISTPQIAGNLVSASVYETNYLSACDMADKNYIDDLVGQTSKSKYSYYLLNNYEDIDDVQFNSILTFLDFDYLSSLNLPQKFVWIT